MRNNIDPVGQLSPQPWMTAPETAAVMDALGEQARFIGGCVRDALAHRPVKDIDIATPSPPDEVLAQLKAAKIKAIPTGIEHGTITAVVNKKPFEITTLRKDKLCDGRHAEVEFTDDWKADAARRDLTINALSATREGAIYDYFNGMQHLAEGRIRFIGLPKQRIEEDYLRILRYFRFFAHYSQRGPNLEALAAMRVAAPEVVNLSGERVREEMLRLLEAECAADVLLRMKGISLLDYVLPEASDFGLLRVLIWLETKAIKVGGVGPVILRRIAALIEDLGSDEAKAKGKALAARYKLSTAQRKRLLAIVAVEDKPEPDMGEAACRNLLYRLGSDVYRDVVLIAWAQSKIIESVTDSKVTEAWMDMIDLPNHWTPPPFPLKGQDALDLGMTEGKAVGVLLEDLRGQWEAEDFAPDRDEMLARLGKAVSLA